MALVVEQIEGYRKLVVWKNAKRLRALVFQLTIPFPKSELKRISQMRDAARSVKQNIQEGYSRKHLGEYLHALEISKGSLAELQGDLEDSYEDGLLTVSGFEEAYRLCKQTDYLFVRLLTALRKRRVTVESL